MTRESQEAWEAGYSIVAHALNAVLAERCPGLSISAAPPLAGVSLRRCRSLAMDALRHSEQEAEPWSVGYINGPDNREVRIGTANLDADERLASVCKFLLENRTWTPEEWRSYIVLAVERDARSWRNYWDGLSAAAVEPVTDAEKQQSGRRKADYKTVQREAALAADWERARETGVFKADFAKQHGLRVKQLDALLDRVAWRNRHSE